MKHKCSHCGLFFSSAVPCVGVEPVVPKPAVKLAIGGYMACGIPLVRSANGNGNGIPLNGIPFPFVSVKVYLSASVNCRKR